MSPSSTNHPKALNSRKYRVKQIWIVFFAFFFIILIIHLLAGRQLQADDVSFHNSWFESGFNLIEWLKTRYATWSSRILIEFVMMILLQIPSTLFCIINSLVITTAAYLIYRLFAPKGDNKTVSSIIVCLLWLCIPFKLYTSVGWIAGSLNYVWPLTALLVALLPLKKLAENVHPTWHNYGISIICAIFATQSEQTVIILLVVSVAFLIHSFVYKKSHVYTYILLLISIIGALFVFLCPGNIIRTVQETATWFPEYVNFTLIDKFDLSFSAVTWNYYYNIPIFALLISSLSFIIVMQKNKSWLARIISVYPLIFTVFILVLFEQDSFSIFSIHGDGIYSEGHLSLSRFLFYSALLLSFCFLIIDTYLIFKNKIQTLIGVGILLLGFASQAILGFSPTVWASGERTGFIMFISICAMFIFLLNSWDFKSKQSSTTLVVILSCIAGYTTLNQLFLLSPYLQ